MVQLKFNLNARFNNYRYFKLRIYMYVGVIIIIYPLFHRQNLSSLKQIASGQVVRASQDTRIYGSIIFNKKARIIMLMMILQLVLRLIRATTATVG